MVSGLQLKIEYFPNNKFDQFFLNNNCIILKNSCLFSCKLYFKTIKHLMLNMKDDDKVFSKQMINVYKRKVPLDQITIKTSFTE